MWIYKAAEYAMTHGNCGYSGIFDYPVIIFRYIKNGYYPTQIHNSLVVIEREKIRRNASGDILLGH